MHNIIEDSHYIYFVELEKVIKFYRLLSVGRKFEKEKTFIMKIL